MRSDTVIPLLFFDKKIAEVFGDVHSSLYLCIRKQGEVLEWLKRHARGTPGKRVTGKTGSQVRILFSPLT